MQQQFEGDVTFVGVAGRDDLGPMLDFVNEYGVDGFDHVADIDGSIWSSFQVPAQPAFAFIDDDGSTEIHLGTIGGEDALRERVEELVASSPSGA